MALRDDSQDVERVFTTLVEVLWAQDGAARLRRPLQVSELYQHVLPYRVYRERLAIDANQDYEMALLRLLAGEGGYAAIQPEEARTLLAEEAASPSPDPSLVREYAAATVVLDPAAVKRVLARDSGFQPAPTIEDAPVQPEPAPFAEPVPVLRASGAPVFALEPDEDAAPIPDSAPASVTPTVAAAGGSCKSCGRTLPLHRQVTFCPFCGQQAGVRTCRQCGEEFEPGWRFCVACGTPPGR